MGAELEKYFEVGWEKPDDDLPANVLDILDRLDGKKNKDTARH